MHCSPLFQHTLEILKKNFTLAAAFETLVQTYPELASRIKTQFNYLHGDLKSDPGKSSKIFELLIPIASLAATTH